MGNAARVMKNCGLAEHTLIVISLRKFIQLQVSSRYFLESFLCNVHLLPRNISFFARHSRDCLLDESTRDGINAIQKLRISFRLDYHYRPVNFCVDLSIAEIRLKTYVIEG